MNWHPHVTVATIVEKDGLFLMVEEKKQGQIVINQPAGHLEANETLFEAAIRETLEETQWRVKLSGTLGCSLYTSPANTITYLRFSFIAQPIELQKDRALDPDIERAVWMSRDQLEAAKDRLRSKMVLNDIRRYEQGERYPMALIQHIKAMHPQTLT